VEKQSTGAFVISFLVVAVLIAVAFIVGTRQNPEPVAARADYEAMTANARTECGKRGKALGGVAYAFDDLGAMPTRVRALCIGGGTLEDSGDMPVAPAGAF
jgi:hypothetical protein